MFSKEEKFEGMPVLDPIIPQGTVLIPISRFEELLDTEIRTEILVEKMKREVAMPLEDIFYILGYGKLAGDAKERREAVYTRSYTFVEEDAK